MKKILMFLMVFVQFCTIKEIFSEKEIQSKKECFELKIEETGSQKQVTNIPLYTKKLMEKGESNLDISMDLMKNFGYPDEAINTLELESEQQNMLQK